MTSYAEEIHLKDITEIFQKFIEKHIFQKSARTNVKKDWRTKKIIKK